MTKDFQQFIEESQSAKCPKGFRFDTKLKSCVPKKRYPYYPYGGGYRGGDNRSDSGNGGNGNGNGSNGNGNGNGTGGHSGGNGNGSSGGNGGGNGGGGGE